MDIGLYKHLSRLERKFNIIMINNLISKKCNDVFNIAKGIGIILIVIGHMHPFFDYNSKTYMVIYAFHMPLFICISGVFINRLQKGFIKKDSDRLSFPISLPAQLPFSMTGRKTALLPLDILTKISCYFYVIACLRLY